MKRVVAVVFGLVVGMLLGASSLSVTALETPTHWDSQTTLTEVGPTTEQAVENLYYCENRQASKSQLTNVVPSSLGPQFYDMNPVELGEQCVVSNNQGSFISKFTDTYYVARHEASYYSPINDTNKFMKWYPGKGTTNWYDPAPQGNNVLELKRSSPYDAAYNVTVHKNLKDWGKVSSQGTDVVWTSDSELVNQKVSTKFSYENGDEFSAIVHRFSPNGRFLLIRNSEGLVLVDLVDYTRKMVYISKNSTKPVDFAVSSDGKFIALTTAKNELELVDTSGCELVESFGHWQKHPVYSFSKQEPYPGCRSIRDYKADLTSEELLTLNAQIRGLHFDSVGKELFFSIRSDAYSAENPVHEYSWTEYKFTAEEYVSTAAGYLAMGDSYSSGEGDNKGGDWYEPGTDEQGNESTFSGRNLCHLSRRSYPYLIALELGYLQTNTASPPADGLFHSVACSGAKIHNVIGSGQEEKHDDGNKDDFENTPNQYRYIEKIELDTWQPGFTKQTNSLDDTKLANDNSRNFKPEIITLGIGGNDGGFGEFLKNCTGYGVVPGTCEYAKPGTDKSTRLGVMIARQKQALVDTYRQIKAASLEASIYVHGYPHFIRGGGGRCDVNVRLDDQERAFAVRTITYMNQVVSAAAQEAGVVYIDVEDILSGGKLCDDGEKFVNGATAGNDQGFGAKVLGNESFHPNPKGFEKYKAALLQQSDKFTKPMPDNSATLIPLPPADLFGDEAQEIIQSMNNQAADDQPQYISSGLGVEETGEDSYQLEYDGLYPGSTAELEAHSTPTSLGSFTVDSAGKLIASFALPDLESGYHELHLKGFDRFGRAIDVFESFVVAFADDDLDGDGVKNELDQCPGFADTNIDADKDGIDDACDPEITQMSSASTNYPEPPPEVVNMVSIATQGVLSTVSNLLNIVNQSTDSPSITQEVVVADSEGESNGETLARTTAGNPPDALKQSTVSVQWWLIALSVSFIGSLGFIVKRIAYAKTN